MSIEEMKQALEALKNSFPFGSSQKNFERHSEAIIALLKAIKKAEQAQPVAWQYYDTEMSHWFWGHEFWGDDTHGNRKKVEDAGYKTRDLFTYPPQRTPLHDQTIFELGDKHLYGDKNYGLLSFARAIEQAHGIGDEG